MAWTGQTFVFGSVLTSSQMNLLQGDITALANGDSGAPSIVNAAMGNNAIHTPQMANTIATSSTTTAGVTVILSGGLWNFLLQMKTTNALYVAFDYGSSSSNPTTSSLSYVTAMAFGVSTGGGATASIQYNYIAASPPYDMGDGEIPLFIFVVIDNSTGKIESTHISPDPVWVANGPTKAMPDMYRYVSDKRNNIVTKVPYKIVKDLPSGLNQLSIQERLIAIKSAKNIEVEITQDIKHADKDILPHPWVIGNDLADKTVIMLDPVSDTVLNLFELNNEGEDIASILHDDYIKIGNTPLSRVTPSGILIPSTTWRA